MPFMLKHLHPDTCKDWAEHGVFEEDTAEKKRDNKRTGVASSKALRQPVESE